MPIRFVFETIEQSRSFIDLLQVAEIEATETAGVTWDSVTEDDYFVVTLKRSE